MPSDVKRKRKHSVELESENHGTQYSGVAEEIGDFLKGSLSPVQEVFIVAKVSFSFQWYCLLYFTAFRKFDRNKTVLRYQMENRG